MKPYKDVQNDRIQYHSDGLLNTVHRSSLYVPEISNSVAEISFLNHFLLKRGYERIGCRITGLDSSGARIESRLLHIDEPRVYTIRLAEVVRGAGSSPSGYLVEFFSAENLYIPFPAVMVNHVGAGFINEVHSYNRILNDVFEDDAIRMHHVREASVDVSLLEGRESIFFFTSGTQRCDGELSFELTLDGQTYRASLPVSQPRLTTTEIKLRDVFPDLRDRTGGVLRISQPEQFLFYGRMLAGQRSSDGAFSANHSYYDLSEVAEYWDDQRPAAHIYPYFAQLDNRVRIYPIMTPGTLDFEVTAFSRSGKKIFHKRIGTVTSPGDTYIDCSVNELAAGEGHHIKEISSFALSAIPKDTGTPTRINHQLVYSAGNLESSINTSLFSTAVFVSKDKPGYRWGQAPVGGPYKSLVGFAGRSPDGPDATLNVDYYTEDGLIASRSYEIPSGAAHIIDVSDELDDVLTKPAGDRLTYVWYKVESKRNDLGVFSVVVNEHTGHCTGEHAF